MITQHLQADQDKYAIQLIALDTLFLGFYTMKLTLLISGWMMVLPPLALAQSYHCSNAVPITKTGDCQQAGLELLFYLYPGRSNFVDVPKLEPGEQWAVSRSHGGCTVQMTRDTTEWTMVRSLEMSDFLQAMGNLTSHCAHGKQYINTLYLWYIGVSPQSGKKRGNSDDDNDSPLPRLYQPSRSHTDKGLYSFRALFSTLDILSN